MESRSNLPIYLFNNQEHWHKWLEKNNPQIIGIWLKIAKKSSTKKTISYIESLESLCYGWIDNQKTS